MTEEVPTGGRSAAPSSGAAPANSGLEPFAIRPGDVAAGGGELFVGGELRARRAGVAWGVLRFLLHATLLFIPWLLLRLLARFFVGLKQRGTLRVAAEGLILRRERTILGRRMRESETSFPFGAVLAVGRVKRYRWLHLLLGLLCLAVGGAVGIVAIHDGITAGYAPVALAGFGLLGLGVVIDLALNILVPAAQRLSTVEIRLPREDVWLVGVEDDLAETFVRVVRARVAEATAPPAGGGGARG